jgi:hypothetical protein
VEVVYTADALLITLASIGAVLVLAGLTVGSIFGVKKCRAFLQKRKNSASDFTDVQ